METNESLLADVDEVARMLCCSARHVWALASAGKMPPPIRLGRAVRWNRDELRRWIAAGAPHQGESTKGGK